MAAIAGSVSRPPVWRRVAAAAAGLLALAVLLTAALAPRAGADGGSAILAAELAAGEGTVRLVLDLTRPRDFRLAASPETPRLSIDFLDTIWAAASPSLPQGLVSGLSAAPLSGGGTRVTVALAEPVAVADVFYLPAGAGEGYRFVLDLAQADGEAYAALASRPLLGRLGGAADDAVPGAPADAGAAAAGDPPAPAPAAGSAPAGLQVPLPPRRPDRRLPVVVIDAGHGGRDPGAVGVNGELEKDVTLAVARLLAARLQETGRYRAVLTRDDDTFLPLRQRVAVAREAGADLFVSLHADSLENNDRVRGASIYTVSDTASDREAAALARRENRADALAGLTLDAEDDVTASILIDLAQRLTRNDSFTAAEFMVESLAASVPVLPTDPHRQAGFLVLTAPDVPSLLIEMGYLSNAEDEAQLTDAAHQGRLADAIFAGVERYFTWVSDERRS